MTSMRIASPRRPRIAGAVLLRRLAVAGLAVIGLAACGPAGTSSSAGSGSGAAPAGTTSALNPSRLGSLKNYSATAMDNGVIIVVSVHSPTDWQESVGGTTGGATIGGTTMLHIKHHAYVQGSPSHYATRPIWYENPEAAGSYEHSPYPGAVANFTEFANSANVTITRRQPCSVAGISGHTWTLSSPATSTLTQREYACVADSSGVLLSLRTTARGTAVPTGGVLYTFVINQIGGTPVITVPSPTRHLG